MFFLNIFGKMKIDLDNDMSLEKTLTLHNGIIH